jgi:hypothetical protein
MDFLPNEERVRKFQLICFEFETYVHQQEEKTEDDENDASDASTYEGDFIEDDEYIKRLVAVNTAKFNAGRVRELCFQTK